MGRMSAKVSNRIFGKPSKSYYTKRHASLKHGPALRKTARETGLHFQGEAMRLGRKRAYKTMRKFMLGKLSSLKKTGRFKSGMHGTLRHAMQASLANLRKSYRGR